MIDDVRELIRVIFNRRMLFPICVKNGSDALRAAARELNRMAPRRMDERGRPLRINV